MKRIYSYVIVVLFLMSIPILLTAQQQDSTLAQATLQNVIQYAIKHQPLVNQSLIDEAITETQIKNKLADWYPQVNFNGSFVHNFKLQTTVFGGNTVQIGVRNTSVLQLTATQNIFNRDVLLASRTKNDVRLQARQNTSLNKIDVAANVSKAFYDVLATLQQIKVNEEDIVRLQRSLKDARSRYEAGITDKTDYKRATIALNNAMALKKTNEEALLAKQEVLKTLMGYPINQQLNIVYDSLQMENEIAMDTLQRADYTSRMEYQYLETQRRLLESNMRYEKWSFLPTLSANGAYNFNYLNDEFGKLYSNNFPNSFAGLTLAVPIFQGGKRTAKIQQAEWQLRRINWDLTNLRNAVNSEYTGALAAYKSSLASYLSLKENMDLAKEVYDVIQLQYNAGVKTYLEVVTAETDLRTAQINYFNALYRVLSSKIDVQKALGQINY